MDEAINQETCDYTHMALRLQEHVAFLHTYHSLYTCEYSTEDCKLQPTGQIQPTAYFCK